jgi:hypothetical protein
MQFDLPKILRHPLIWITGMATVTVLQTSPSALANTPQPKGIDPHTVTQLNVPGQQISLSDLPTTTQCDDLISSRYGIPQVPIVEVVQSDAILKKVDAISDQRLKRLVIEDLARMSQVGIKVLTIQDDTSQQLPTFTAKADIDFADTEEVIRFHRVLSHVFAIINGVMGGDTAGINEVFVGKLEGASGEYNNMGFMPLRNGRVTRVAIDRMFDTQSDVAFHEITGHGLQGVTSVDNQKPNALLCQLKFWTQSNTPAKELELIRHYNSIMSAQLAPTNIDTITSLDFLDVHKGNLKDSISLEHNSATQEASDYFEDHGLNWYALITLKQGRKDQVIHDIIIPKIDRKMGLLPIGSPERGRYLKWKLAILKDWFYRDDKRAVIGAVEVHSTMMENLFATRNDKEVGKRQLYRTQLAVKYLSMYYHNESYRSPEFLELLTRLNSAMYTGDTNETILVSHAMNKLLKNSHQ